MNKLFELVEMWKTRFLTFKETKIILFMVPVNV